MQYLDALEGLRSQGFPQESISTKRYEILQRFMEGVRDPLLRRELAIAYAAETFLTDPPTVESLRFTTRQLQRNRPKPANPPQPYDPRLAMRSRPHPFVPLPPNQRIMPQGVLPPRHPLPMHLLHQLSLLLPEHRWATALIADRMDTLLASALTVTWPASLVGGQPNLDEAVKPT